MRADINDGQIPLEGAVTVTFGRARSEEGRRVINVWRMPFEASLVLFPSGDWNALPRGDTRNIQVTTAWNSWSVRSTANWLRVYPLQGPPGGSFTITADPNHGPNRHPAQVIVSSGTQERSISVNQATGAIQCPPIALVTRGTAAQYLDMEIGWPLGHRGYPHTANRTMNRISSRFGPRTAAALHMGIDIGAPVGSAHILNTPIIAAVDGVVVGRRTESARGAGFSVSIRATCNTLRDPETEHQLIFTHSHMRNMPLMYGTTVRRGEVIGHVGETGNITQGTGHLHFEVNNSSYPWGPGTTRESWIRYRINPLFFYPVDSFQGLTDVWNEISTTSRSLDLEYDADFDIRKFRPRFYDMALPFAELVGLEVFDNWLLSRSDEERENENVAVSFIRDFNISREDFTRANEELRQIWADHGASPTDSDSFELYPVDLIFTFDNERINRYFLRENSAAVVNFGMGMEIGNARPLFYNMPGPFAELVGRETFIDWKYSRSSAERANESIAVSFIRNFNISREDFTAANEETRYVWDRLQASAEQGAIFETYDVDMIFSFDNEKINEFFLWENSLNPDERELGQRQLTTPTVAAGHTHSVALREDGTVWAWGANNNGQLGDGTVVNRHIPVQVQNLENVIAVAARSNHSIALKEDGTVWVWGGNAFGQLGDGTVVNRHTPVQVQNLMNITAIAAGSNHNAALREDGTIWAWGLNTSGQLGDGTAVNRYSPVQVQNLTNVTAVAAGGNHSVALREDGTIWAWGTNNQGQLGDGTITNRHSPVQVQNLENVLVIAAGGSHSVALREDGTVWAWGANANGALGDGTTEARHTPVQVQNLTNVTAISVGGNHSVALREDGTVWAWGSNGQGQLGDGTITNRHTPVQVQSLENVIAIAAAGSRSVALREDGTVWAWGSNRSGQLGDDTTTDRHTPVQVQNLENVIAIAAGSDHSFALREDGTVWAWGENASGRLGDGTMTHRHSPVQVQNLTNVIIIAAGGSHSVALREDGTVWAWGFNGQGQLADDTIVARRTPVQVLSSDGQGFLNLRNI